MEDRYDVVIVGAGTAGLSALSVVRRHTDRFLLVNDGPWGTTCARVGCMPSKALIGVADKLHQRHLQADIGLRGGADLRADMPAVLAHVRAIRDRLVDGVLETTAGLDDRVVAGRARLAGPDAVEVDGRRVAAGRIVVAAGSSPVVPARWRSLGDRLLTTDTLFEQRDLPRRIGVVGLGAVGVEMAQALARLGTEVTGFDSGERIGGLSDPEVSDEARGVLAAEFPLHLAAPTDLRTEGDGVAIEAGGARVVVDKVLVALGRRPNVDGLGLETLGVPLNDRGLPAFEPGSTQVAGLPVFIAGDLNANAPVLHEGADEGWIAGYNATRDSSECFARRVRLRIVFTDPNLCVVGTPYRECDRDTTSIGAARIAGNGRLKMSGEDRGIFRLYFEHGSQRLIGAELCAPHGEHIGHLLALAVQQGVTLAELLRVPWYHPTVEEALRAALRDAAKRLSLPRQPDLAWCERPSAEALR